MTCKKVLIKGRVQAVFFRVSIKERANNLGIKGWVKNLHNGDVEAIFEGDPGQVDELVEYCKVGPRTAKVSYVDVKEEKYVDEFDVFEIRY